MYKYEFTKQVVKFFVKQDKILLKKIYMKLEKLVEDPYNNPNVRAMSWKEGHYRFRIWNMRFLYTIDDGKLIIYFYKAWFRGGVYKK